MKTHSFRPLRTLPITEMEGNAPLLSLVLS